MPGAEPYTADGRIFENQITGNWKHRTGHTFADGVFVLVVNPMANAMYGYSSARTETGAMIYETWTLAKKTGSDLKTVNKLLQWAEETLRAQTVLLPLPKFNEDPQ